MQNFDIEAMLGYPIAEIDDMIANMADHVKQISIPKKDGGVRRITAPDDRLKAMQNKVLHNVLYRYGAHNSAHGFIVGRSTVTAARLHCYQRSVFGADIKSFFDNINAEHVKNVVFGNANICEACRHKDRGCTPSLYRAMASQNTDMPGDVPKPICEEILAVHDPEFVRATGYKSLLTRVIGLSMYRGHTPQGFPTSPAIGNIVLKGFDRWMTTFARENELVYTRYADDITLSGAMEPRKLAGLVIKPIRDKLFGFGFRLNKKKTRSIGSGRKQMVTGIVVNNGCSLGREHKRLVRARVHQVVTGRVKPDAHELMVLKGDCAYLSMVSPQHIGYLRQISRFITARKYVK